MGGAAATAVGVAGRTSAAAVVDVALGTTYGATGSFKSRKLAMTAGGDKVGWGGGCCFCRFAGGGGMAAAGGRRVDATDERRSKMDSPGGARSGTGGLGFVSDLRFFVFCFGWWWLSWLAVGAATTKTAPPAGAAGGVAGGATAAPPPEKNGLLAEKTSDDDDGCAMAVAAELPFFVRDAYAPARLSSSLISPSLISDDSELTMLELATLGESDTDGRGDATWTATATPPPPWSWCTNLHSAPFLHPLLEA